MSTKSLKELIRLIFPFKQRILIWSTKHAADNTQRLVKEEKGKGGLRRTNLVRQRRPRTLAAQLKDCLAGWRL